MKKLTSDELKRIKSTIKNGMIYHEDVVSLLDHLEAQAREIDELRSEVAAWEQQCLSCQETLKQLST